ncbi:hypothetical protein [Rhodoferax sp.]|uniref:hypothetical protein n=1 Tax=Rhodoferax sp. TaxID=50421 RepID=UPI00262EA285|nr:hypothetical protein [Rhodoferax sp.]MDD3936838.1 hypothetical protein [Rhodoferax sp.]
MATLLRLARQGEMGNIGVESSGASGGSESFLRLAVRRRRNCLAEVLTGHHDNTIESVNMSLRKITKTRGSFPTDHCGEPNNSNPKHENAWGFRLYGLVAACSTLLQPEWQGPLWTPLGGSPQ